MSRGQFSPMISELHADINGDVPQRILLQPDRKGQMKQVVTAANPD